MDRPVAAYISGTEIQSTLRRQPADHFDRALHVVDTGSAHVGVAMIRRPQGWTECNWARLDQVTEVMRVVSGTGTFVTGGELKEPQPVTAADADSKLMGVGAVGTDIVGGNVRHVVAGDVVIIPAGVPHGFRTIDSDAVVLELVRVDTGKVLALK
jgi:mannose-6-phosphate isomerase-like protein (cupin superfamily)